MRYVADFLGLMIAVLGVILAIVGWVASEIYGTSALFWLGLATIVFGWLIGRAASTKPCPRCAEKIKIAALKCKHCGSEIG